MITLTVTAAGQMMTLLYSPSGFELFIIASILVSLGAIPVALSTSPSPEQPGAVDVNLRRLYRISPSATLGCLTAGLANGAFLGSCTGIYRRHLGRHIMGSMVHDLDRNRRRSISMANGLFVRQGRATQDHVARDDTLCRHCCIWHSCL